MKMYSSREHVQPPLVCKHEDLSEWSIIELENGGGVFIDRSIDCGLSITSCDHILHKL